MPGITILIVDDHFIFREGLKGLIHSKLRDELLVIGEACNGIEAIEFVLVKDPDIVLMDIQMTLMDGIKATRELKRLETRSSIIGLSTFNDNALIQAMVDAGAKGFLLKNASTEELQRAARTVAMGGYHITQDNFLEREPDIDGPAPEMVRKDALTNREIEVIRMICGQLTNKEIAASLNIDVRSVETHRENIMKKLKVKNGIGIALYASRTGIV